MAVPALHVHSAYSMRRGTSYPGVLAAEAGRLGYTHVALTDRDGLWGVPGFLKACRESGIAPILGAQLTSAAGENRALVLTENLEAFRALSELVSMRQLADDFDAVEAAVERAHEGFVVIADTPDMLRKLHPRLPPGRLFGEAVWGERSATRKRFFEMLRSCRELKRPPVASGNVYMAARDDYMVHAFLTAMRMGRCLKDRLPCADPAFHLKASKEFEGPYHAHNALEALINAREVAVRCAWKWPEREWLIPKPPNLPSGRRPIEHLRDIVTSRLRRKYGRWDSVIQNRLDHELRIIESQGFESFFLIVGDVVREARSRGYRTLGRGSAGDSIVSYGLDITQVDPIRYDLYFERFLNPERSSPPDIDLDFSWAHRDEMVKYVEELYGPDKVASVGTIVTLGLRGAFREVAKALGYSNPEISRWCRYLPDWSVMAGEGDLAKQPVLRHLPINEEPLKTIIYWARKLETLPVHQSVHVGGLVLSPEPIARYVPLARAAKGFVITQYDMRDCEEVGLIKLDLLSQRGLGVLEDALEAIELNGGKIDADIEDTDVLSRDQGVARLYRRGQTLGCFDSESPFIRQLIRKLGEHSYDLHIAATAIIRPGVSSSGMMEEFIRRHRQPDNVTHIHPALGEILRQTHGVIVYQEDVLKVLHELAGVSLAKADLLRRMMSGKKVDGKLAKEDLEREFIERCRERGISSDVYEKLWEQIASFAGFSFCKAHAAQFAILAYQTAYLKAHFPAEFFAARLSNEGGYYAPDVYIRDARRFGLSVELPEVNRSNKTYTGRGSRVIMGLKQVGCLTEASVDSILLARHTGGPFKSVADFLARTGIGYEQTHALIRVGAFRSLHAPRPVLLAELAEAMRARVRRPGPARQPLLFADRNLSGSASSFPHLKEAFSGGKDVFEGVDGGWARDYTLFEQIQAEVDVLGMIVSIHPLEPLQAAIRAAGLIPSAEMMRHVDRKVKMGGILVSYKVVATKAGDPMAMVTLEDLSGMFDAIIFPEAYRRYAGVFRGNDGRGICFEGKVQVDYGAPNLIVEKVEPLSRAIGLRGENDRTEWRVENNSACSREIEMREGQALGFAAQGCSKYQDGYAAKSCASP